MRELEGLGLNLMLLPRILFWGSRGSHIPVMSEHILFIQHIFIKHLKFVAILPLESI